MRLEGRFLHLPSRRVARGGWGLTQASIGGKQVAFRRTSYASDNGLRYALHDSLGSTTVLIGDGSPADRIREEQYLPFGHRWYLWESDGIPAETTNARYRFTGQPYEVGLDLYDYGARWYDQIAGRFLQADTIIPGPGNPQALNRFSYTLNNPLRYIDPSGHEEQDEAEPPEDAPEWLLALWRLYGKRWREYGLSWIQFAEGAHWYEYYAANPDMLAEHWLMVDSEDGMVRTALMARLFSEYALNLSFQPSFASMVVVMQEAQNNQDVKRYLSALGALALFCGVDVNPNPNQMTGNQVALKKLVDQLTKGGRKRLTVDQANIIMEWAAKVRYPGFHATADDLAEVGNH